MTGPSRPSGNNLTRGAVRPVDTAKLSAPTLDHMLCFAIYNASAAMTRLYRPLLEPLGLTYPQYLVMLTLWDGAPRSVGELGNVLGLDSGTLTPLLKRIQAAGLVSRQRDPADERRVLIDLTSKGMQLKDAAANIEKDLICSMQISSRKAHSLNVMLRALTKAASSADQ